MVILYVGEMSENIWCFCRKLNIRVIIKPAWVVSPFNADQGQGCITSNPMFYIIPLQLLSGLHRGDQKTRNKTSTEMEDWKSLVAGVPRLVCRVGRPILPYLWPLRMWSSVLAGKIKTPLFFHPDDDGLVEISANFLLMQIATDS